MNIKELADEIHGKHIKVKKFRKVISYYKNNIWSMDIVQMDKFGNENNGFKYILNCIDVYSRYVWRVAMKTKNGNETTKAIEEIINKAKTSPDKFWTSALEGVSILRRVLARPAANDR